MAQKVVDRALKRFERHPLSGETSVTVTPQGEVEFRMRSDGDEKETLVHFNRYNWAKYVCVARPQVLGAIRDSEPLVCRYHKSKSARVDFPPSHDGIDYVVKLLTLNNKGTQRTELCVFLSSEEFQALEKVMDDLNEDMDEAVPSGKKTMVKGYTWVVAAHEGKENLPVRGDRYFYLPSHAIQDSNRVEYRSGCQFHEDVDWTSEWVQPPNPTSLLSKALAWILYERCFYLRHYLCPGCGDGKPAPEDDVLHSETRRGCRRPGLELVRDHIAAATRVDYINAAKELVKTCCEYLKVEVLDMDKIMEEVYMLWDLEESDDHLRLAVSKVPWRIEDREFMLIQSVHEKYRKLSMASKEQNAKALLLFKSDGESTEGEEEEEEEVPMEEGGGELDAMEGRKRKAQEAPAQTDDLQEGVASKGGRKSSGSASESKK